MQKVCSYFNIIFLWYKYLIPMIQKWTNNLYSSESIAYESELPQKSNNSVITEAKSNKTITPTTPNKVNTNSNVLFPPKADKVPIQTNKVSRIESKRNEQSDLDKLNIAQPTTPKPFLETPLQINVNGMQSPGYKSRPTTPVTFAQPTSMIIQASLPAVYNSEPAQKIFSFMTTPDSSSSPTVAKLCIDPSNNLSKNEIVSSESFNDVTAQQIDNNPVTNSTHSSKVI